MKIVCKVTAFLLKIISFYSLFDDFHIFTDTLLADFHIFTDTFPPWKIVTSVIVATCSY